MAVVKRDDEIPTSKTKIKVLDEETYEQVSLQIKNKVYSVYIHVFGSIIFTVMTVMVH